MTTATATAGLSAGTWTIDLEYYGVNPGMGHGEVAGFEASVVLNRPDFGMFRRARADLEPRRSAQQPTPLQ